MKCLYTSLLVLVLTLLPSCSDQGGAVDHYAIKENALAQMQSPAGKARIIFMRPDQRGGNAKNPIAVYDNGSFKRAATFVFEAQPTCIGILPNKSYFTYLTEPGRRLFAAHMARSLDFLEADITAGKTYYVTCLRQDIGSRVVPVIRPVKKNSETMGNLENILPTLSCAELTDRGSETYRIRNSQSTMYIQFKSHGMPIKTDYQQEREKWERQLPLLEIETPISRIVATGPETEIITSRGEKVTGRPEFITGTTKVRYIRGESKPEKMLLTEDGK